MKFLPPLFWSCLVIAMAADGGNETDNLSLLDIKAKITQDPLGVLSSWNASTDFCSWSGVTCSNKHQRVTVLDLSNSLLSGTVSPYIGNLSFLKQLQLQNNSFSGQIPPEIGRLRRLHLLFLNNNSFQGTIPANLSACSELTRFIVGKNQLSGEIPMELGSLSKLWVLHIAYNNLTGTIPSSFGNLSSLEQLQATRNSLVGMVPDTLGKLRNLTVIGLGGNMLSGSIPPSIFNLSSITHFDMTQNQLHGTLPSNLFNSLPNLVFFSIAYNQFTGSIPVSIHNASSLSYLQLNGNNLAGDVPSLDKLNMLQAFRLTGNQFGSGEDEDLSFICSLANATSLQSLALNSNNFGGVIPECIGNLSTTLTDLLLDHNNLRGTIPPGIGNLVNLERMELRNNQLSGYIPADFGKLQDLRYLLLNDNNLSGVIPSSLGSLRLLLELYLYNNNIQGSIPSSLGQCQNLVVLSLFNNNLSGSIPPQVMTISSLSIALSLSRNQLTGSLPKEVENLKNLGFLGLSHNLLSGEIPSGLGGCVKLERLNLSSNFFHGSIPSSLSSLRGLESLDLSHNKFSGFIPVFLEDLSSLGVLNLSYNSFEGMVPTQGVFNNANATLVSGNSRVCGGIPELELPKCKFRGSNKTRLSSTMIVVIGLLSGFVLVVVLVLLSLLLFKFTRQKVVSPSASSKSLWKMSYQDILHATDGFASANMIGMGSFGSVYKGVLDQGQAVVAIKVLNLLRPGAAKSFIAECEAMRNMRHRNLVKVLTTCSGVDYGGNDFKALVYELMVNGSLDEWLHPHSTTATDEAPRKLDLLQRLNIVIDVANALHYLHHHHHQSPIVHCDLKPSNVLLDSQLVAHVSDFGLARFIQVTTHSESSSIAIKGSIGYTAPEYGMGSQVSSYGDVYSYGILLLEVFTGKRPTDAMFEDGLNLHNFVKAWLPEKVTKVADPILVADSIDEKCLISIFGIGVACSAHVQRERLGIDEVVAQLSSIREKLVASQFEKRSGLKVQHAGNKY